ncbi:MAG TPA: hypothetical protein VHR45_20435 [Thermoanaerobaculia bacterium]|nr:hypothetical protein [Thermoanaerobaculia bacterium]
MLAWIRAGGEEQARQRALEEAKEAARESKLHTGAYTLVGRHGWVDPASEVDVVNNLANLLGEGLRDLFHSR